MLVVLPGLPWINVAATTLLYVYLSQAVSDALSALCALLLPRNLPDVAVAARMGAVGALIVLCHVVARLQGT